MNIDKVYYDSHVKMAKESLIEYLTMKILNEAKVPEPCTREEAEIRIELATYKVLDKVFNET